MVAQQLRRNPCSLHHRPVNTCLVKVNYGLSFAIAVTVFCLNASWFFLLTSEGRGYKSAQRNHFDSLNIPSISSRALPGKLLLRRHELQGINNRTDVEPSLYLKSDIYEEHVKRNDDVIIETHPIMINDVAISIEKSLNTSSSNSKNLSFACPLLNNLDGKKQYRNTAAHDASVNLQQYVESLNISSYIPRYALPRICGFIGNRSPTEIDQFQSHVKKFEDTVGVDITALPKKVRYLLSIKVLTILGYEQKLPSALIVGSKKAGTTALRFTLNLHPQVNLPKRELEFFSRFNEFERGLDYYRSKFDFCKKDEINVEKSPAYFHTESVPKRIKESLGGKTKLILCVRDPLRRTISDFHHTSYKRMKITDMLLQTSDSEGERFKRELIDDNGRLRRNLTIITESLYSRHLQNWLQYFDLDNFLVIREEDIRRNLPYVMAEVEQFLNVEPFFQRGMFTYKMRSCVKLPDGKHCAPFWGFELPKPRVNESLVQVLRDYFRPFNQEFEKLTNKSYSWTNL